MCTRACAGMVQQETCSLSGNLNESNTEQITSYQQQGGFTCRKSDGNRVQPFENDYG
jgi:hypothetical protein